MKDFISFLRSFFKNVLTSPILHGLIMGNAEGQLLRDGHTLYAIATFVSFAVMLCFMILGRTAMGDIERLQKARASANGAA